MEVYGMKTQAVDTNNSNLYEYDRVYVNKEGENVPATILNVADLYHPEFRILIDRGYWKNDANPEYVELNNGSCTRIKENEHGYRFSRSYYEFKSYCWKYDYHRKSC